MNTQQPLAPAVSPRQPRFSNEQIVSMVLAAAGIGVTLIGVVLLLAMAAREGMLTPPIRVAGGALLSGALAGAALWIRPRQGGRLGSVALLATGAAAAFFDVVAVTRIYSWVPLGVGLLLALAVGAAAGVQAIRWDEKYLFQTVTTGVALLAPFLTHSDGFALVAFLTVLQLVGLAPELRQKWDETAVTRTVPVVLAGFFWAMHSDGVPVWQLISTTSGIALIGGIGGLVADRTRSHTPWAAAAFVFSWIPLWVSAVTGDRALRAFVDMGALLVAGVLLVALQRNQSMMRLAAVVVTGVSGLMLAVTFAEGQWRALPFVAAAVVLMIAHLRTRHEALGISAGVALALGVALEETSTSLTDLFYRSRAAELPMTVPAVGVLLLAFAGFTALAVQGKNLSRSYVQGMLVAAGASGIVGMAMTLVTVLGSTSGGFFAAHLLITVLSLTLAALALTAGLRHPRHLAASMSWGLVLVGCALTKLFLFDLHYLGSITKAFTFVGAGLVLLAAGTVYARTYAVVSARTKSEQIA